MTERSIPDTPLQEIEGVPLLFGSPHIERRGNRLIVHADIIASTFFLVTRYEEAVRRDVRDEHGRFPGRESLAYRAGFLHRPVVDEYAALLRNWLREVGVDVPEPRRRFSVLLTHDVDRIQTYQRACAPVFTAASALLGRQPLRNVPDCWSMALGLKRDPLDTFDEMIELDGQLGERNSSNGRESVYFFRARHNDRERMRYDIHSRPARRTLRRVVESGATVGLHASYNAGLRPELIAEEKATLEDVCGFSIRRNRHHFLSWREIEDGWALAKAGIDWDSTLGYADVAGFRLGVCRPIPLFDPISMKPFGIEEHPLLIMECSLSRQDYMGLGEEDAFEHCKRLIAETRNHNGEFVMLWHNTEFAQSHGNYHPRLYRRLLAELGGCQMSEQDRHSSDVQSCGERYRRSGQA